MDDPIPDPMSEVALDAAFAAAFMHQHFLATIVTTLVARGALLEADVALALNTERQFIETLRPEGLGRLEALANEELVALLRQRFAEWRRTFPPLVEWRRDPEDPRWPTEVWPPGSKP